VNTTTEGGLTNSLVSIGKRAWIGYSSYYLLLIFH